MAAPYHHRRFTSRATAAVAVALTALAMLSAGPSSASPSATATTTTAPTIASSATSTDGYVRWLQVRPNTTSVTLWWTSYHSTTFMVRRDDGVGDPTPTSGSLVYSGTEFRTVDTAVTPWTTYRYTLWGDDGAGGYLPPQSIRATTGVQGVTGLTATATSAGTAAVSWDAPSDPGVALVTLTRTDPQGAVRTVYSGTAAKTVDTGLMPGAAYSYTVVAQDAPGRRGPVARRSRSRPTARGRRPPPARMSGGRPPWRAPPRRGAWPSTTPGRSR